MSTIDETRPTTDRQPRSTRSRADRLSAAAGAAFVVCVLAGNTLTESVVGTDTSAAGTAADLAAQAGSTAARAGMLLELVGLVLLAVFTAALAGVGLRRSASPTLPVLVASAGVLVVGIKLALVAPYLAALFAEDLPDAVRHALVETNGAGFVLTWLPYALLVGAAGLMLLQAGLVGRVLAGSGLVLAALGVAAALVGAIAPATAVPVPFLLSLLWTAAVSVRVATRR